jgi:hypothetical protein
LRPKSTTINAEHAEHAENLFVTSLVRMVVMTRAIMAGLKACATTPI